MQERENFAKRRDLKSLRSAKPTPEDDVDNEGQNATDILSIRKSHNANCKTLPAFFPRPHSPGRPLFFHTDGILGEFLRLQILCTLNCNIHEIDPALLRPGRLVARRHFGRLEPADAQKLASAIGREIQQDNALTLAEILCGPGELFPAPRRRIGFCAERLSPTAAIVAACVAHPRPSHAGSAGGLPP
jgi:hypothetical protein